MVPVSEKPSTTSIIGLNQKVSGSYPATQFLNTPSSDHLTLGSVPRSELVRFGDKESPTHITPVFSKAFGRIITDLGQNAPRATIAQILYSAATNLDHGGSETDAIEAMRLAAGYSNSLQSEKSTGAVRLAQLRMLPMQPEKIREQHQALLDSIDQQPDSMLQRETQLALSGLDDSWAELPTVQEPGTVVLGPRYIEAVAYAAKLHQTQIRSDTKTPYLSHLLAVSAYILLNGGDEDTAIAGLLHDAVEDQGGRKTLHEIQRKFGRKVAGIISDCTQPDVKDWYQSKRGYIDHLRHVKHPESYLVASADKLHNLQCLTRSVRENGEATWKHFWKGKNEQIWFYQAALQQLETHSGLTPLNMAVKKELQLLKHLVFQSEAYPAALTALEESPLYRKLSRIVQTVKPPYPMLRDQQGMLQPQLSSERLALHEKIYRQMFSEHPEWRSGPKTAHMVTGLLGSGKTSKIIPTLSDCDHALVVDNDLLRSELPEYSLPPDDPHIAGLNLPKNNGLAATALQRESGVMCNTLLNKAIGENGSFVITHSGSNYKMDLDFLRRLKAEGYRTFLHHVEIPPNMAIKRANKRFFERGRFIPPHLIANLNTLPTENFLALKKQALKEDLLDGYAWHYNGVPDGDPPILVESWERPEY